MILRNFLFLDTDTLDDYLAALEGYVIDSAIDQTETEKKDVTGKAGYKILEGELTTEKSKEMKQRLAVTNAAKFQRLYEILEKQEDGFRYLDLFDQEIWEQIRRGDLLEIEARIHLPKAFTLMQTMDDFAPWMDIMSLVGEEPLADAKTKAAFEGLKSVSKISEGKPIPIVFESSSTPTFCFTANLQRRFLKCQLSDIEGDATVFGKVQRVIKKGEKIEVFSLLPAFSSKLPSLNTRQKKKMQQGLAQKELAEVIKGPALVISPVALYR
ncbi:MAG: hypothetical protein KJZ77_09170 [Anaerolineales bacterium]|nr:hypothetical protein [Anaerolineales bacterium]